MPNLELDTKLWRYMSFDKFVDLIRTSELYFSDPSQFDDTWELYPPNGLLNPDNLRRKLEKSEFAQTVDLDKLIENTIGFFEVSYLMRDQEYAFSCWSSSERDHAGLWSLYTDRQNAVAISTTPEALLLSIKAESHHVVAGHVVAGPGGALPI